jgi:putative transposase
VCYNEGMPVRPEPFATDEVYHIFNRGVNRSTIFHAPRDYQRFYDTIHYYQLPAQPVKLSYFLKWRISDKNTLLQKTKNNPKKYISFYCYVFMPNHFHFLIKQLQENGISEFMRKIQNSYAKYINTRYKRTGGLFEGPFRAIRVKTQGQLLHLSRYIHLNPYTTRVVKTFSELTNYPWSSFSEYRKQITGICETDSVLSNFLSIKQYEQFCRDQADYQRELNYFRHLTLE